MSAGLWELGDLKAYSARARAVLVALKLFDSMDRVSEAMDMIKPVGGAWSLARDKFESQSDHGLGVTAAQRELLALATIERASVGDWERECRDERSDGMGLDSHRTPQALAWAWQELDERERALAMTMRPSDLERWLGDSFEASADMGSSSISSRLEFNVQLRAFGSAPDARSSLRMMRRAEGLSKMCSAKSLDMSMGPKGLWAKWAKACAHAAGSSELEPWALDGVKCLGWSDGDRKRAACAMFGGLGLSSVAGISKSSAMAMGVGAAATSGALVGFGALCLGAAMLWRLGERESSMARHSASWGKSGSKLLSQAYPYFEKAGVFSAWGKSSRLGSERSSVIEGYTLGLGKSMDHLWRLRLERDDEPGLLNLGGSGWSQAKLAMAVASRIERTSLGAHAQAGKVEQVLPRRKTL